MPNPFLYPSLTGTCVGLERPVAGDVAAFLGVVVACVPEGRLTGQVLGVGHSVHVQVSGDIESVRKIVEVTVMVVVVGMEHVGGGGGSPLVEVEQGVEEDEVLTVEVEQVVEDDEVLTVEVEQEVEDDGVLTVEVEQEVEDDEVLTVEVEQEVEDDEELVVEVEQEVEDDVEDEQEVDDDGDVGDDDGDVGQGGYNTIVVVAHPVRQAVSQAVVV